MPSTIVDIAFYHLTKIEETFNLDCFQYFKRDGKFNLTDTTEEEFDEKIFKILPFSSDIPKIENLLEEIYNNYSLIFSSLVASYISVKLSTYYVNNDVKMQIFHLLAEESFVLFEDPSPELLILMGKWVKDTKENTGFTDKEDNEFIENSGIKDAADVVLTTLKENAIKLYKKELTEEEYINLAKDAF